MHSMDSKVSQINIIHHQIAAYLLLSPTSSIITISKAIKSYSYMATKWLCSHIVILLYGHRQVLDRSGLSNQFAGQCISEKRINRISTIFAFNSLYVTKNHPFKHILYKIHLAIIQAFTDLWKIKFEQMVVILKFVKIWRKT